VEGRILEEGVLRKKRKEKSYSSLTRELLDIPKSPAIRGRGIWTSQKRTIVKGEKAKKSLEK